MRGAVWCKLKVFLVNRDSTIRKSSGETLYSYGAVTTLNNSQQQAYALQKAINKGLATYRQNHNTTSDTEVNYVLLDDGIQYTKIDKGQSRRLNWKQTNLSPSEKRQIHNEVYTNRKGKGQLTEKQKQKQKEQHKISKSQFKEQTRDKYEGKTMKQKPINTTQKQKEIIKELKSMTPKQRAYILSQLK